MRELGALEARPMSWHLIKAGCKRPTSANDSFNGKQSTQQERQPVQISVFVISFFLIFVISFVFIFESKGLRKLLK